MPFREQVALYCAYCTLVFFRVVLSLTYDDDGRALNMQGVPNAQSRERRQR